MAAKFVCVDHDTPLLMPPDLRDWVPEGHLVHFIRDAVLLLDVGRARVNERGTGSPQYPPTLMLGLLIDSYATGTFSSRRSNAPPTKTSPCACSARTGIPIPTASAPSAGPTARCCKAASNGRW